MEDRIVEFAGVLRHNGVRVSLSENMDAFRALQLLGVSDPARFRNALRATLVKRGSDIKSFEELFDYFFLGIGQALDALDRRIMEEWQITPEQFQKLLDQVQRLLKKMEGNLSDLSRALLTGNHAELERLLREAAAEEAQAGTGDIFRLSSYTRMAGRPQMSRGQTEVERFRDMLRVLGETGEGLCKLIRYLDGRASGSNPLQSEGIQEENGKAALELGD